MSEEEFLKECEALFGKLDPAVYRERVRKLFCMWNHRMMVASYGHYLAASSCERRERLLSIANIAAAILVLFLSANTNLTGLVSKALGWPVGSAAIAVSTVSLVVVMSSAAQYILQFGSRAALHKNAGNEFSNLRRKIERYWSRNNLHPEAIHALNRSYNMISKAPPLVPPKLWLWAQQEKRDEILRIETTYFVSPDLVEDPNDATERP
ncbi:MAG: SLATT domain-containing protein [Pseudomonadota bacterium]